MFPNDTFAMHNGEKVKVLYVASRDADGNPARYMVRHCDRKKGKARRISEVCATSLTPCHD